MSRRRMEHVRGDSPLTYNYPVALESREGIFKYLMLPRDPGPLIVCDVVVQHDLFKNDDTPIETRRAYFDRVDEVVECEGMACTVYKERPRR